MFSSAKASSSPSYTHKTCISLVEEFFFITRPAYSYHETKILSLRIITHFNSSRLHHHFFLSYTSTLPEEASGKSYCHPLHYDWLYSRPAVFPSLPPAYRDHNLSCRQDQSRPEVITPPHCPRKTRQSLTGPP